MRTDDLYDLYDEIIELDFYVLQGNQKIQYANTIRFVSGGKTCIRRIELTKKRRLGHDYRK